MEIEVRDAAPADLGRVVALLAAQLQEHAIPIAPEALRYAAEGLVGHAERGAVLLAWAEGEPVAVAAMSYSWTLEHGGPIAWLDELYVVPELRCRGIGGRLLLAAMERARTDGRIAMDLEVETSHVRVEGLYAREGFRPLDRRHWTRRLDRGVPHLPDEHYI
ncbi:MAG TPA: GNAT family N-acetyltransferase [Longimicrobium sp.]|nr:GNAT family N-acetyltransferase [Longimicrobium sp.]